MPQEPMRLPFEIDEVVDPSLVTGRAGVPLVIELFQQLGVAQVIDAQVPIKQRQRGLRASQLVATLVTLWVTGGTAARTSRRSARTRPSPRCSAMRCPRPRRSRTAWRPSTARASRFGRPALRRPSRRSRPPLTGSRRRTARW